MTRVPQSLVVPGEHQERRQAFAGELTRQWASGQWWQTVFPRLMFHSYDVDLDIGIADGLCCRKQMRNYSTQRACYTKSVINLHSWDNCREKQGRDLSSDISLCSTLYKFYTLGLENPSSLLIMIFNNFPFYCMEVSNIASINEALNSSCIFEKNLHFMDTFKYMM